jgi:PAS domain S-box-containing protein
MAAGTTPAGGVPYDLGDVLRSLPEPVIITDLRGRVTCWSSAAEQLLGWPASDAVGRSLLELGVSLAASSELRELARAAAHGKSWEGSLPVTGPLGRTLLLYLRGAPLLVDDEDGQQRIIGIVVTFSDLLGPRYAQHRAASRAALLSRAGMLLGTSLDTDRTLAGIAELLVPSFADHCIVDLLDENRVLRRAVTVNADDPMPNKPAETTTGEHPELADGEEGVGRAVNYPPDHPCARALASGRPVLVDGSATASRRQAARDAELDVAAIRAIEADEAEADEHAGTRDGAGLRVGTPNGATALRPSATMADEDRAFYEAHAVIAVPLLAPSGPRGVLAVAASDGQRQYESDDVELLEELAARAGLALENAALYDRKRSLALALQHSLLPDALPHVDGLEIDVGYRAGEDSEVGGDLYDVVPLSAGRVGIVVGDVQGRGAHAYAVLDLEPAQLLTHLDELVRGLNEALLVTCVYAVYDPFTRRCILANAGHPPPLLAGVDGCFPMEVPPDVPLGVGGVSFTDHGFTVPAGDTVVLYTDGVVERRDEAVDQGVRALCAALERLPARDPELICRATLAAATGPADDDQAVLAMRTSAADLPMSRLVVPGRPEAAPAARHHVRAVLASWGLDEQVELAELVVSELISNAVRHAARSSPTPVPDSDERDELSAILASFPEPTDPDADLDPYDEPGLTAELGLLDGATPRPDPSRWLELTVRRGQDALWIEVYDPDVRLPRLRTATENDEGGRGLYLVETLSQRWGARPTRSGKLVWAELPINPVR